MAEDTILALMIFGLVHYCLTSLQAQRIRNARARARFRDLTLETDRP